MERKVKILIVEDEMLIGAKIGLFLAELGYEVTGMLPRAEDALPHILHDMPDMALLDVRLKGPMDGIRLGEILHREHQVPVIFLTANADDDTFQRAKAARPFAFLQKPFRKTELKRALELAVSRMELDASPGAPEQASEQEEEKEAYLLRDRIFLRFKERMVKIMYQDILYVEADRSYCKLVATQREYLLSMPLKKFEDILPTELFQRTHRSYLVNLHHVDEVVEGQILVANRSLPLSSSLREAFIKRLYAG